MDPVQQSFNSRLPPLDYQKEHNSEESVMLVASQISYPDPRVHGDLLGDEQFSSTDAGYIQEPVTLGKNPHLFSKYQNHVQTSLMSKLNKLSYVNLSHSQSEPPQYLHQLPSQQNFHRASNQLFFSNSSQSKNLLSNSSTAPKIASAGNSPVSISLHHSNPLLLLHTPSLSSQPPLRLQKSAYFPESDIYSSSGHGIDSMSRPTEFQSRHTIIKSKPSPQTLHMQSVHTNDVRLPIYHPAMNQHGHNIPTSFPPNTSLSTHESRETDPYTSHPTKVVLMIPIHGPPRSESQLHYNKSNTQNGASIENISGKAPHVGPDAFQNVVVQVLPEQRVNMDYRLHQPNRELDFVFVHENSIGSSGSGENNHNSQEPSRKRHKQSFADDMERHLKTLVNLAAGCTFEDLAQRLKRMDTTDPIFGSLSNTKDMRLDRHHQLFGLAWIVKQCEVSYTTVVTRTRVYARYVDTCAQQKISPLMPTNFGKLVRITFPNITIRRLGMRGKSKYYYCGVKLIGEPDKSTPPLSPQSTRGAESPQSVNAQTPGDSEIGHSRAQACTAVEFTNLNEHFQKIDLKYVPNLFSMIESSVNTGVLGQGLEFPSIYSFLPDDIDIDYSAADDLQTSYKAHLSMVFELFRYMQIEKVFELAASLLVDVGTNLTLLADEALAGWVKDCDLVMYRCAAKMLARLHLHNVPAAVVDSLKKLSREYYLKVSDALLKHFPPHFVTLKIQLAKLFMDLVSRLLFCIESGVHVSAILSNPSEKVVMLEDWLSLDIPDIVLRELPCKPANIELLIEILDTRLVKLLEEPNNPRLPVMAKYSEFLFELPEKFPNASPWLFLVLASNILTTCIREMTLAGSRSFKSWWILRCWVDEFIKWYLELGGYLYDDYKPQIEPIVKSEDYDGPLGLNHSFSHDLANQESNNFVDLLEIIDNGGYNWM